MAGDLDLSWPQARMLMAVIAVYERDGFAEVRTVAREARRSLGTTQRALQRLRNKGVVTWEPGKTRTLRPLARWEPVVGGDRAVR